MARPPVLDPNRSRGSFREPPQFGPPQPSARDAPLFPPPSAGRVETGQWGGQSGSQAPRPPQPPRQPPQQWGGWTGQPWPGPDYGPVTGAAPAPPASYAERIRVDELMPRRRVLPSRGWRLALYKATFGLVNLGPSADEIRQAELENKIKSVLRGHYKVGVMGKGGVGKTTVSACVGSMFAELRHDDRVVAIDADTAFGKLGSRVDPKAPGSYWELASDQHLETFADVRARVGNNADGLFVLAGEATPARRRVLDAAIYREATSRLDRYFTISIIDCSSTMDSPVTQELLRDLDALIVVSSPWMDGGGGWSDHGLAGRPWIDRSAATNSDRAQRFRRTCRQTDPVDPGAAIRLTGSGRHRGAVRRASAARRRHRPNQRDVARHEAPLHRDRGCARRALSVARRSEPGEILTVPPGRTQ